MTEETPTAFEEERAAIARIGFTPDGALLHRYLRRVLESVRPGDEGGALLRHEGARIFARDLMAQMAEGIESGRSDAKPLAPARTGAIAVARARGIARRVGPSTQPLAGTEPEPGTDAT